MMPNFSTLRFLLAATIAGVICVAATAPVRSSDHDDTPQLKNILRHDARITDLFVFRRGDALVLALCTNPAIPPSVTTYRFPPDLTLRIFLDQRSAVHYDDDANNARFGGTIARPAEVAADVVFEITFDNRGNPRLRTDGLPPGFDQKVRLFVGLRDDPFIRTPRRGLNVAAVVIEVPIAVALRHQPALLVWATSSVLDMGGPIGDLGGRSLRSQFAPNLALNDMPPAQHFLTLGVMPDVVIYNVLLDRQGGVRYPNGRDLDDDVIAKTPDIPAASLGPNGLLMGEPNDRATTNDVPFLDEFPYLAPPHPPAP
jgi:hypothetical protein